jgi:hypothetical protein
VSYTDKLFAKASVFLAGTVALRCVKVGAFSPENVDNTGAEEFGWLKIDDDFSGGCGARLLYPDMSLGDPAGKSIDADDSNESGGSEGEMPCECACA